MRSTMIKRSGVLMSALILSGCINQQPQTPAPVEPVPPPVVVPEQPKPEPEPGQNVPPPPKLQTLNWSATVSPLVAQMLKTDGISAGNVLLVDNVKNSTNGSLQSAKATDALQNSLANNGRFTLVTPQQLKDARQTLGLSVDDSLVSRSKAIGLARYVGAQYVLYSNAEGDIKSPSLQMQLMLVQTGEIIWSGSGDVVH